MTSSVRRVGSVLSDSFLTSNMYLGRAAVRLCPRPVTGLVSSQLRFASSSHHAHEEHTNGAEYSPEGLPVWFFSRN